MSVYRVDRDGGKETFGVSDAELKFEGMVSCVARKMMMGLVCAL